PCGPAPLAKSCTEPCIRQRPSSALLNQPRAVLVSLPGPMLSSLHHDTLVGSSTSAAAGSILSSQGVPISSGGFGLSHITSCYCGRRFSPS
ncbi:KRF2 protein, partial [Urocolius indicus]|nr:KRF2 protein [Urocolius indicus]